MRFSWTWGSARAEAAVELDDLEGLLHPNSFDYIPI